MSILTMGIAWLDMLLVWVKEGSFVKSRGYLLFRGKAEILTWELRMRVVGDII